jgi:hypothetical protein
VTARYLPGQAPAFAHEKSQDVDGEEEEEQKAI